MTRGVAQGFERRLEGHRRSLWLLAYRLTGDATEADDVVQETFRRAVEHLPRDQEREMKPWLLHVATNVARDVLTRLPWDVVAGALSTVCPPWSASTRRRPTRASRVTWSSALRSTRQAR